MIKFGVAGFPPAFEKTPSRRDRITVLRWLSELGLDAFELQMTYGPRTSVEVCRQYRAAASEFGISLSVHASYFIVFTSTEKIKIEQSIDTLKRTYELCSELGSSIIVLHPGPLYGESEEAARGRFLDNIGRFMASHGPSEVGLFIETAGKVGQLGSVDDILEMSALVPGVFPCIDFGHVHARTLGTLDNPIAVDCLTAKLHAFGRIRPDSRIHFHYTPIHYGPRGEISHRALTDLVPTPEQGSLFRDEKTTSAAGALFHPRPEAVSSSLRRYRFDCTVISETMNTQEEGALTLKRLYGGPNHEEDSNHGDARRRKDYAR